MASSLGAGTSDSALTTDATTVTADMIPGNCLTLSVQPLGTGDLKEAVTVYPNPFGKSITIFVNDMSQIKNSELKVYNLLGQQVMQLSIINQSTTLETSNLVSGIYFYRISSNNKTIQSGKLISQQ